MRGGLISILKLVNPNYYGVLDLLSGILLLYTESFLPLFIADAHSWFLIFKGVGTLIQPFKLRWFGMSFFILAGAADMLSATILLTGQPPVLAAYKEIIALVLGLKGVRALFMMM